MTYDEALVIVEELRGHIRAPFSIEDRRTIERVYPEVVGRTFRRTRCNNCYKDAVIEMAVKLRKEGTMRQKSNYHMRNGFIIRSAAFDGGAVYSNANLTDDVARRYLEAFPEMAKFFDVIPEPHTEEPAETAESPSESAETLSEGSEHPKKKTSRKARKNG